MITINMVLCILPCIMLFLLLSVPWIARSNQSILKEILNIHWKDWCWSWNSNTLATWCEELTHWKRPWCWERLKAVGEGDDRGWDGWRASLTQWVEASSRRWWRTRKPGALQSMGLQRVIWDWVSEQQPVLWGFSEITLSVLHDWSWFRGSLLLSLRNPSELGNWVFWPQLSFQLSSPAWSDGWQASLCSFVRSF